MKNCPHCGGDLTTDPPPNNHEIDPRNNPRKDQSLSGSDPVLFSVSSPDPICNSAEILRNGAVSRVRGAAFDYPAEFEAAWSGTGKTGSKFEAFLEWKKVGRPTARVIRESWARWAATDQWRQGFVPHVRRWLRGRCFEQDPPPDRQRNGANGSPTDAERRARALQGPPPGWRSHNP